MDLNHSNSRVWSYLDRAQAHMSESGDDTIAALYLKHKQALEAATGHKTAIMPQKKAETGREFYDRQRQRSFRRHMAGRGGRGRF